jgi:peptidoglycan/xylan/chitin deacetylase (PgdA/CDA1 family)
LAWENELSAPGGGAVQAAAPGLRMTSKIFIYHLSKRAGLFRLARRMTRRKLRILCYHGFGLADEDRFSGKLFISRTTFERRMRRLAEEGIPVLPLEEAVEKLRKGSLPDCATVITIDDGFYSVHAAALPVLARRRFPATVYVTSYYADKQTPIFRLVVRYMFWKTDRRKIDIAGLIPGDSGGSELDPRGPGAERWMWKLIEHGETQRDEAGRCALSEELGRRLGVSYGKIVDTRMLSLMTDDEMRELLANRVDIQLHTHRHRFPTAEEVVMRELEQNEASLMRVTGRRLRHFCYPSGEWSRKHWPWLDAFGVDTAVTCERGLNTASTPRLAMKRFLDGENVSEIEFEAEICGFSEFLRALRRAVTGVRSGPTRE